MDLINSFIGTIMLFTNFFSPISPLEIRGNIMNNVIDSPKTYISSTTNIEISSVASMNIDGFESVNGYPLVEGFKSVGWDVSEFKDMKYLGYSLEMNGNDIEQYVKENGTLPSELVNVVILAMNSGDTIATTYNGKSVNVKWIHPNPLFNNSDVFTTTGTIFDGYTYNTNKLYSTKNGETILDTNSDGTPEYTLSDSLNIVNVENSTNSESFPVNVGSKITIGSIWSIYAQKNEVADYKLSKIPFLSIDGNLSYIVWENYSLYTYGSNKISSDITWFDITTQKLDETDVKEGIENNSCETISNSIVCDASGKIAYVTIGENLVDRTFIITSPNLNIWNGNSYPVMTSWNEYLVVSMDEIGSFNEPITSNDNDLNVAGLINMYVDWQNNDTLIIINTIDWEKFFINKTKKVVYKVENDVWMKKIFVKYGNIDQININTTGQLTLIALSRSEIENAIVKRGGETYSFDDEKNIMWAKTYNVEKYQLSKTNSESWLYSAKESFYSKTFGQYWNGEIGSTSLNDLKSNDLEYSNNPNTFSQFISIIGGNGVPTVNKVISWNIEESHYPIVYWDDLSSVYGVRSEFNVFNTYSPLPNGISYESVDGRNYVKFTKTGLDSFSNVKNYVRIVGWNANLNVNLSGGGISNVINEGSGLYSFKVEKGLSTTLSVEITDSSSSTSNVSYIVPVMAKWSEIGVPTDGSLSIWFMKGDNPQLYGNVETNEKNNFFRINPYGYFTNPYDIFIRKITVKLVNDNSDDFFIEGIVSESAKMINSTQTTGGYDNMKTRVEGGKQVVEFDITNFRGDIKWQNFLFKYNLKKVWGGEYNGKVTANVTIDYSIWRIWSFTLSGSNISLGGWLTTRKLTMLVNNGANSFSQTYNNPINIKVINNNSGDIQNSSTSLNFVNAKWVNYPVINSKNLSNDNNLTDKYFNMILDVQKNVIDSSKYDSQRIRAFYQGDNDLEVGGYGNWYQNANWVSSTEQTYMNGGSPVYWDNQYQYSSNNGYGSAHYFSNSSNSYSTSGGRCQNYTSYTPNVSGLNYGLISTIAQNVSANTTIGKPNPMVEEMSLVMHFDNLHKTWKHPDETPYKIDMIKPVWEEGSGSLWGWNEYKRFPLYLGAGWPKITPYTAQFNAVWVTKTPWQEWSVQVAGNSPYISYDLNTTSNNDLVYEDWMKILLPSNFNGKVSYVQLQYMWDYEDTIWGNIDTESLGGTIQWWYKHKNLIRITIKFNNAYSDLYTWTKNDNSKLVRLVLPVSNPWYVWFTNESNESGKQSEDVFPELIKLNNYITGGGQLKYDVFFNAKQKYSTVIQKVQLYSWVNQTEIWRCGKKSCYFAWCRVSSRGSSLQYDGTQTMNFVNGYYYLPKTWQNGSFRTLENTWIGNGNASGDYRWRDTISSGWNPNIAYTDLWVFLALRKEGKIDGSGYNEYLFKSLGNFSLKFQNIYSPITVKWNVILPTSMSNWGYLKTEWKNRLSLSPENTKFLPDSEYDDIRKTIFEWNPKLNKPSIKNYFLNNSYNEVNKVGWFLDDSIVSSFNNNSNWKVKVNYFGNSNLTIEKNLLIDYDGWIIKSYFEGIDASSQSLPIEKGMNVFITDWDVFINGDIIEKWYNKDVWIIIIARNVVFGSKPQVFNGWIIADEMGVEYNQKLFILNGGITLKSGIQNLWCERMSTQKPEIAMQTGTEGWTSPFQFLDTELVDGRNAKSLYSIIWLSCTIINNGKYQMFTSKWEFLEKTK